MLLASVSLCSPNNVLEYGSTWLESEFGEEIVVTSKSSHHLDKGVFYRPPTHLNCTGDAMSHCREIIDLPHQKASSQLFSVHLSRVELIAVLNPLAFGDKWLTVNNLFLSFCPVDCDSSSTSGIVFDGSKTEH